MKHLKRLILTAVILSLGICTSGCIIIPRETNYHISPDEVSSIQFYDLNGHEARYSGFQYNLSPVYTLSEEDHQDFLAEFSKLEFSDTVFITIAAIDSEYNYGNWVVRINFSDGSYTLYSSGNYGETFNAEESLTDWTRFSCEPTELAELIHKYYSTTDEQITYISDETPGE